MAPLLRGTRRLKWVLVPIPALVIWMVCFYAWHLPALFEAHWRARRSTGPNTGRSSSPASGSGCSYWDPPRSSRPASRHGRSSRSWGTSRSPRSETSQDGQRQAAVGASSSSCLRSRSPWPPSTALRARSSESWSPRRSASSISSWRSVLYAVPALIVIGALVSSILRARSRERREHSR